ncbi:39S ribosomal protein L17, mitochondrial isoform X2 [Antechinus flavipes]|uniref:39S ribosomal protein L17, mitochondrial isoform X2 n=1 Tax=Antechinus flavipes TaxID=38775 RepID=UPI0022359D04|nr:39S ribosomal protein L17, mitochondrial isoform X2 [Antechinus flavipes]
MRLSVVAAISHGRVYRRLGLGPESRIHLLRNLLTGLVRHERIEAPWARVDEMRGYAERLIDYGKLGDTNEKAMRMADFWLTVIHIASFGNFFWIPCMLAILPIFVSTNFQTCFLFPLFKVIKMSNKKDMMPKLFSILLKRT